MWDEVRAALDRRLDPDASRPVAVAFSGGGDSLAALIAVLDWARPKGRSVVALTVDHRIQAASAAWTRQAGEVATRLGAKAEALVWDDPKPATGLPAAARRARHNLLAAAARSAGAAVIVTGHTADDAGENAILGQGPLHDWAQSPVWPEGRDLFLLRPLLGQRREAIREALRARGETWIDDPANDDLASPRIRARKSGPPAVAVPTRIESGLARTVDIHAGAFRIDRAHLLTASAEEARRVLAAALACAGGSEIPPRTPRLLALLDRLQREQIVKATLSGAKLLAKDDILIVRNGGEAARGGLAPVLLNPGESIIWDGRYEIDTDDAGLTVRSLQGYARRLPADEQARLALIPAAARPSLPLILGGTGPTCPILATETSPVRFRALAAARFLAACGAIAQEKAASGPRHGATAASVLC